MSRLAVDPFATSDPTDVLTQNFCNGSTWKRGDCTSWWVFPHTQQPRPCTLLVLDSFSDCVRTNQSKSINYWISKKFILPVKFVIWCCWPTFLLLITCLTITNIQHHQIKDKVDWQYILTRPQNDKASKTLQSNFKISNFSGLFREYILYMIVEKLLG